MDDLRAKAEENKEELAALMITYPSTHGILKQEIKRNLPYYPCLWKSTSIYGRANMNAQSGLTNPGFIGADVCHLNLHKKRLLHLTVVVVRVWVLSVWPSIWCLSLPGHGIFGNAQNRVSSAPFGSAGILPITYGYIRMMGTGDVATKNPRF